MWVLFHKNAKTKVVAGGERFVDTCPSCNARATFTEVEVSENVGMFFVDLIGDTKRGFRCGGCGDLFDRAGDDAAAAPEAARPAARPDPREVARAQRELEARRAAEAKQRAAAAEKKAIRIEDELAELKKRLGR